MISDIHGATMNLILHMGWGEYYSVVPTEEIIDAIVAADHQRAITAMAYAWKGQ